MNREEVIALSNSYTNAQERDQLKKFFSDKDSLLTNRRTIVFSTPSETGTSYFRILEPLLAIYRQTDDFNLVYTEQFDAALFEVADLIVFHRAGDRHDYFHDVVKKYMREKIKPVIIHDVDDNEFNLPASHPMKAMWLASEKDKMSLKSINESDLITTTTRKLKTVFSSYNKNVHIFRNKFNWNLPQWNLTDEEKKARYGDKMVLGWAGLTSHYNDILKMKPILKDIHDKYPFVHFVLAGMALSDKKYEIEFDKKTGKKLIKETDITAEEETYRKKVEKLFSDFDQTRLSIENAVPLEEYGKFYSWFDMGVAFIEHNGFNACKSEIKVVEYCKYGAIPVFSNYGGYKDFAENIAKHCDKFDQYKTKLTCDTEQKTEWVSKLSYFIEMWKDNNEEYRAIGSDLKKFVEDEYMIDKDIDILIAFYSNLIEANRERELERINKY